MHVEKRAPFIVDEAKFSTQRLVTYIVLAIFAATAISVLTGQDQAERSTIIQTVINFTMMAMGFWLGTSKSSADKEITAAKILEAAAPAVLPTGKPIEAKDVTVKAEGDVSVQGKA